MAIQCIKKETTGHYCTDLFDFHPVSVSSDGTDLVAQTPFEISAWCRVNDFCGQTTPAVIYPENIQPAFDEKLMSALLDCQRNASADEAGQQKGDN